MALRARHRQHGFTLMELVVTLALLGLMAAMAAPLAELALQRQREQELRGALREIRGAIDRYHAAAEQGLIERRVGDAGYPPDLETLVAGVPNVKSPSREPMFFLRRVPRDPFADDERTPAAATWALRSSKSPADRPEAGADVYDVISAARGTGLNGVPYSEW